MNFEELFTRFQTKMPAAPRSHNSAVTNDVNKFLHLPDISNNPLYFDLKRKQEMPSNITIPSVEPPPAKPENLDRHCVLPQSPQLASLIDQQLERVKPTSLGDLELFTVGSEERTTEEGEISSTTPQDPSVPAIVAESTTTVTDPHFQSPLPTTNLNFPPPVRKNYASREVLERAIHSLEDTVEALEKNRSEMEKNVAYLIRLTEYLCDLLNVSAEELRLLKISQI